MKSGQTTWVGLTRRAVVQSGLAGAGLMLLPGSVERALGAAKQDAITTGSWLAGDTHVHDDHSSDGSIIRQGLTQDGPGNLSVGDQIGQGERTGLDWMPLTDHRTYDQVWDPQWKSSTLLLLPGEEAMGSPHAICLGAVDVLVDPSRPKGSADHRHLQQVIWDAHSQGAVWSVAHPDDFQADNLSAIGPDTFEVWNGASHPDSEIDYAEARWNLGYRTGVVGACDDHFKELWAIAGPGQPTTWVHASARTERAVLDGLRAGRTSVSRSPLGTMVSLEADLDGDGTYEAIGGDEVHAKVGTPRASLRVRVRRGLGATLYIYTSPGRSAGPVSTTRITSLDQTTIVPISVKPGQSWWRAEVRSVGAPPAVSTDLQANVPNQLEQLTAIASPVFVTTTSVARPKGTVRTPDPSGTDRGRVVLGAPEQFTGFPDLAVTKAGTHLVAEHHKPGVTEVVYRRPDGQTKVLASGSARMPKVAARGASVWVAWQDERAGQIPHSTQIYLRHSADGGHTWGKEARVSDGRGRQERPALALTKAGHPIVAWQAATGGAVDILALEVGRDAAPVNLSATNKRIVEGNALDTRSAIYPCSLFPDIAVLPDGAVAVVWQDNRYDADPGWTGHMTAYDSSNQTPTNPDSSEPMLAVRKAGTWSAPIRVAPDKLQAACHPSIAASVDGTLVCAWDSRALGSSGVNARIRTASSKDGGRTWSKPVGVDRSADHYSQRPRLGTNARGAVTVVWTDSRSADWRWQVRSATFGAQGWTGHGTLLAAGNCTWPTIDAGVVVAVSDRGARPQRDRTQRIVTTSAP